MAPTARSRPAEALVVLAAATLAGAGAIFGAPRVFVGLSEFPGFAAQPPALQEALVTVGLFGLLALISAIGLSLAGGFGGLAGRSPVPAAAAGAGLGVAGIVLCVGLVAIAGGLRWGATARIAPLELMVGVGLVAFQAGVEELYFRGWLQPALQRGWGRWAGIVAAALVFAMLHLINGAASLVVFLNLFIGGLWFGILADRSGGIVLPAAAHFAWNWSEASLLGLAPNPGVGSFGTLADLDLIGPALWGGTPAGLNASLAMTFVLLALTIVAATWRAAPISFPARRD